MAKRILLCDDEVHIVRAAEFKLQRAGYDVVCAGDGEAAWVEIQRECPDLLISDYQMPRLDGFGLCQRIRQCPATRHLPILMLTAKGFELSHREVIRQHGVLAVLAKPFSPRALQRMVDEICRGQSPGTADPADGAAARDTREQLLEASVASG
jgi:two-component system alkaline phosphatase synthesis response regulator PhoP